MASDDVNNLPAVSPRKPTVAEARAREACEALLGRASVMVFPLGMGDGKPNGSGVVLATPSGTPYLLSASHVFENESCSSLIVANQHVECRNAGVRLFKAPCRPGATARRPIDVAAVALSAAACAALTPMLGAQLGSNSQTTDDSVIIVSGFPSYLCRSVADGQGTVFVDPGKLTYTTGITGRDDLQRIELEWGPAVLNPGAEQIPHRPVPEKGEFQLGSPEGISGGGVWRTRRPRSDELWSATKHCELIGIAVSTRSDTEFVEPVDLWRPWLEGVIEEIDLLSVGDRG